MSNISALANVSSLADVAELSLSKQAIPQLFAAIERQDPALANGAWLALIHLADEQMVSELLKRLKSLANLNDAAQKLSAVVSAIGEPAIAPLGQYVCDKRRNDQARRLALIVMAAQLPTLPEPVIAQLNGYRDKYDDKAEALNALYEQLVAELQSATVNQHSATLDEANQVLTLLNDYGTDTGIKTLAELDGFFTAIALAPKPIEPQFWLAFLWDAKRYEPNFGDQLMMVYERLVGMANGTKKAFESGGFQANVAPDGEDLGEWLAGFERALGHWPHAGQDLQAIQQAADVAQLNQALRQQWQRVQPIQAAASQPYTRQSPKVGRNDPCPCGSGKKLKKCCKAA